jgi:hypothetical protein
MSCLAHLFSRTRSFGDASAHPPYELLTLAILIIFFTPQYCVTFEQRAMMNRRMESP